MTLVDRWASSLSLAAFRELAFESMEPAAFDYVDGGAWDEVSLAQNEAAWLRYRLRPRVLVDVSQIDPSTTLLGDRKSTRLNSSPESTSRMPSSA